MRYHAILFAVLLIHWGSTAQTVTLPIDFEGGVVTTGHFTNFDGGTATVLPNPVPTALNTSATVARIVRNGGQVWAGAFLTPAANLDFSVNPYICMKVYTDAPVGTRVTLKLEGCGGGCFIEVDSYTTVQSDWETHCFDYSGQAPVYNRITFMFDLGNIGNGSNTSTFYFDDVEQVLMPPLELTPGSQLFCPNAALTFTYPGTGTYNWYSDPAGSNLLLAGSQSFTTGILTGDTSFYVQDMSIINYTPTPFGPSIQGNSFIGNSFTTSTFFTSNLDNGFFHSVNILFHIPTGPPPGNTCTYRVDVFNLTQGTSRNLTQSFFAPVNNTQGVYAFTSPLPIFYGDQLEMRVTSLTGHPCYCTSTLAGNSNLFSPFPNSHHPQLTFTGHTSAGVPNQLLSGLNYVMSGEFVDPTLYQVNAIEDCGSILPVDLLHFAVEQDNGDALLSWTTVSELNNNRFLVMRTIDGDEFELIGSLPGAGNSSIPIDYSFRDREPLEGRSYYRLTQVDHDGSESFSWLVAFSKTGSAGITLFPNPTAQRVQVQLGAAYENIEADILDNTGRLLSTRRYQSAEVITLDLNTKPGNHIVIITADGEPLGVFKVVKTP